MIFVIKDINNKELGFTSDEVKLFELLNNFKNNFRDISYNSTVRIFTYPDNKLIFEGELLALPVIQHRSVFINKKFYENIEKSVLITSDVLDIRYIDAVTGAFDSTICLDEKDEPYSTDIEHIRNKTIKYLNLYASYIRTTRTYEVGNIRFTLCAPLQNATLEYARLYILSKLDISFSNAVSNVLKMEDTKDILNYVVKMCPSDLVTVNAVFNMQEFTYDEFEKHIVSGGKL